MVGPNCSSEVAEQHPPTYQGGQHVVASEPLTTEKGKDGRYKTQFWYSGLITTSWKDLHGIIYLFLLPFSGVILDIEFTQKLQNIMGKGMQTPANNTPTGTNTKTMQSADLAEQETNHSTQVNQQNSGGNSRFSVSPVSETKCANIPAMEGELTINLLSSS